MALQACASEAVGDVQVISKERRNHLLAKMEKLLASGWCQGVQARNADGLEVGMSASDASRLCLNSAVVAVADTIEDQIVVRGTFQELLEQWTGYRELTIWNDDPRRTQAQVLELVSVAKTRRLPKIEMLIP